MDSRFPQPGARNERREKDEVTVTHVVSVPPQLDLTGYTVALSEPTDEAGPSRGASHIPDQVVAYV